MTRISDIHGEGPQRLYRDPYNGWLAGVCAGLADYLSINPAGVRLVTIIMAIFFMPFVITAYIVLALVLPKRPPQLYRSPDDERFWRSMRSSPAATLDSVRGRFRDMEHRLQRMERYVTSEHYNLDREFRNLRR